MNNLFVTIYWVSTFFSFTEPTSYVGTWNLPFWGSQPPNVFKRLFFVVILAQSLLTGWSAKSEKPTSLVLSGPSKQLLGQIAAEIRSYRKPEPYKGKGVIREKEFVLRKEGKKK